MHIIHIYLPYMVMQNGGRSQFAICDWYSGENVLFDERLATRSENSCRVATYVNHINYFIFIFAVIQ